MDKSSTHRVKNIIKNAPWKLGISQFKSMRCCHFCFITQSNTIRYDVCKLSVQNESAIGIQGCHLVFIASFEGNSLNTGIRAASVVAV